MVQNIWFEEKSKKEHFFLCSVLCSQRPLPLICAVWKATASCRILSPSTIATLLLAPHSLAASPRWPILATMQAAWQRTKTTERTRR